MILLCFTKKLYHYVANLMIQIILLDQQGSSHGDTTETNSETSCTIGGRSGTCSIRKSSRLTSQCLCVCLILLRISDGSCDVICFVPIIGNGGYFCCCCIKSLNNCLGVCSEGVFNGEDSCDSTRSWVCCSLARVGFDSRLEIDMTVLINSNGPTEDLVGGERTTRRLGRDESDTGS
ncbi:CYFA0S29e01035g1_1 [Cyberlindnera fabianii]|uniref:CYFA0S29e01035g1_1 n=1 Tax=Cyberlindnera fabianii TaxID=36022 RepID=A0A061BCU6_CYBFA|nr:CYFA0S29e01035g1_1 [Cyberlindnera fabianii]